MVDIRRDTPHDAFMYGTGTVVGGVIVALGANSLIRGEALGDSCDNTIDYTLNTASNLKSGDQILNLETHLRNFALTNPKCISEIQLQRLNVRGEMYESSNSNHRLKTFQEIVGIAQTIEDYKIDRVSINKSSGATLIVLGAVLTGVFAYGVGRYVRDNWDSVIERKDKLVKRWKDFKDRKDLPTGGFLGLS